MKRGQKITCTRLLHFCAGHRVFGHENKCAHVHGHNYNVEITCGGALDRVGRVVDFGVVKRKVGSWIDKFLDHGFLVYKNDDTLIKALRAVRVPGEGQRIYVMEENPTAENIAAMLFERACDLLEETGVTVERVRVWETDNCFADFRS